MPSTLLAAVCKQLNFHRSNGCLSAFVCVCAIVPDAYVFVCVCARARLYGVCVHVLSQCSNYEASSLTGSLVVQAGTTAVPVLLIIGAPLVIGEPHPKLVTPVFLISITTIC